MDIERKDLAEKKRRRRIIYTTLTVAAIVVVTVGVSRLKPAAPSVESATVFDGVVKRGPMVRQVRGTGSLVPEEFRWLPAATDGRIERIFVQAGEAVEADTVVMELSDPRQAQASLDAEWRLREGEANLASVRARLVGQRLEQEAGVARVKAEWEQAKLRADADEELAKQGLLAELNRKLSRNAADELGNRYALETRRLEAMNESDDSQLTAQRATVEQLRALYRLQKGQTDALQVRAGIEGVLQEVRVEVGQSVAPGATLAKIVQPAKLKAELRIPETQAKDIAVGLSAEIDTRNGTVAGVVSRIDPAAQAGSVTVDIRLTGTLPKGARPDLTVDGVIELERLDNVLYVGRPVHAEEGATIGLFKIIDDGREAVRASVRVGRTSVSTIEIVDGLEEGDRVILSDMSQWDEYDRLRLK